MDYFRSRQRDYTKRQKSAILELLGKKCVRCGFEDDRALQIDHVNGGGVKEKKKMTGGTYYVFVVKRILAGSKKYQVLCANCNWIKRFENNETSHL